jgi:hypothetical protein
MGAVGEEQSDQRVVLLVGGQGQRLHTLHQALMDQRWVTLETHTRPFHVIAGDRLRKVDSVHLGQARQGRSSGVVVMRRPRCRPSSGWSAVCGRDVPVRYRQDAQAPLWRSLLARARAVRRNAWSSGDSLAHPCSSAAMSLSPCRRSRKKHSGCDRHRPCVSAGQRGGARAAYVKVLGVLVAYLVRVPVRHPRATPRRARAHTSTCQSVEREGDAQPTGRRHRPSCGDMHAGPGTVGGGRP